MYENLALFKTAHAAAKHAGALQATAAQNIANADTPGYTAKAITPFQELFDSPLKMPQRTTKAGHFHGESGGSSFIQTVASSDGASSPNGNSVSLEQEMLRSVDAQRQHNRALAIYKHTMTVLRSSLGR
ncbi:MAG: FlgB family protein [Paracoccaceae bacterium]|jgi:flagellar basal-body rod protein FlgB|nr:FlgB family protein [Paracoccaceae bacterium]